MEIGGINLGQHPSLSAVTDLLGKLKAGDIIRAQILEFTSNELLLKLFDGTTFKAATNVKIEALPGESIDLVVKSKENNQLILERAGKKIIRSEANDGDELKKELEALYIKPDIKNNEIAREIKQNSLVLNKETFNRIADLIANFKGLNPSKAAFLHSNNIKPVEKNIESLNGLLEGRLKIAQEMDDFLSALSRVKDTALNEKNHGKISESQVRRRFNNDSISPTESKILYQMEAATDIIKGTFSGIEDKKLKDFISTTGLQGKVLELVGSDSCDNIEELSKNIVRLLNTEADRLPLSEQKRLKDFANNLINKVSHEDTLNNHTDSEGKSVVKKAESSTLEKLFEDIFVKLDSKTLEKDISASDTFKKIYQRLENVKEALHGLTSPEVREVLSKMESIENNLKFLNDINNHNSYIQIPINLGYQKATGELYVLRRDTKSKRINPENVTMFISLDTGNIGQIDSLLSINKRNISINMRVEEDMIIEFIRDNLRELYTAFQDKGYKLVDIKYRLIEEKANIMSINAIAGKISKAGRTSIDYRL